MRVFCILLALAFVLAAGCSKKEAESSEDLKSALEEVRAAGLPTTTEELAPYLVPDEENAAILYTRAAEILAAMLPNANILSSIRISLSREPTVEEEAENWQPILVSEELRDLLPKLEEVLSLAHEAARRPHCRFDIDYEHISMWRSHLSAPRTLAPALCARAIVRAEEGDADGAIEDLHALFSICRHLGEEPLIASQGARFGIVGMGLRVLEEVLPSLDPATGAIERIKLDDVRGGVAIGLRGHIVDALSEEMSSGISAVPYFKSNMAYLVRYYMASIAAMKLPYVEAREEMVKIRSEVDYDGRFLGPLTSLFGTDLKLTMTVGFQEGKRACQTAMARAAALLLDHLRAGGSTTVDLSELGAPVDPLTGEPFTVVVVGSFLVLRSSDVEPMEWRIEWDE